MRTKTFAGSLAAGLVLACSSAGAPMAPGRTAPSPSARAATLAPAERHNPPAPRVPEGIVFHPIVRSTTSKIEEGAPGLRLFRTTDGSMFVTAGPQVMRVAEDGSLVRDRTWLGGITPIAAPASETIDGMYYGWNAVFLGGRWPDATFLVTDYLAGFRGPADPIAVHRWRGERWARVATKMKHFAWHVVEAGPWQGDRVLGLRAYQPEQHFYYSESELDSAPGAMVRRGNAAVAKAKRLVVLRGTGQAPASMAYRKISHFASLATGEIMVIEGETSDSIVHYDSGAERSLRLPEADARRVTGLRFDAPDVAWAWGVTGSESARPFLARFDGAAWTEHQSPDSDKAMTSFDVAPGGALWATCGGSQTLLGEESASVWTKPKGQPWRPVAVPSGARVFQVMARTDRDIWLAGEAVYRSGRVGPVVTIPKLDDLWKDTVAYSDPITFPNECPFPVMILGTDADGDYATEQGALAREFTTGSRDTTIRLVEVDFRHEHRLAVMLEFDSNDAWVEGKLRSALGQDAGDFFCISVEPKQEIASYPGAP